MSAAPVKRLVLDRPWILIALAAVAALLVWAVGTRSQPHHLRVAFDEAVNLSSGMDVQAAGVDVGKVSSVKYRDGQAVVELGIDDGPGWPLPVGTTATLRLGSTVGNGNRRIELTPGPRTAPPLPDGGVLAPGRGRNPVEVDQVLDTFDAPARADVRSLADNAEPALQGHTADLQRSLRRSTPALTAAGGVLGDLARSGQALGRLLQTGNRVSATLDAHRERVASLVTVAARTFTVFADNAAATEDTIDALPQTLGQARSTFARLRPSLDALQTLLTRVDPGVRRLTPLARVATPALQDLRALARDAVPLVATAVQTAPRVTRLLTTARPLVRQLRPALQDARPILHCLKPYAPDLAGFLSNWAGWNQEYDDRGHYLRVRFMTPASVFTETPYVDTAAFTKLTGLVYNGIPAAGTFVGKPQYDSACGVGADGVDPKNDWNKKGR